MWGHPSTVMWSVVMVCERKARAHTFESSFSLPTKLSQRCAHIHSFGYEMFNDVVEVRWLFEGWTTFYLTSLSSTFLCLSFRLHKIVCPLTFLFHSPYSEDLRNRLFTRAVPKLFRNGAWMYLMNDCSCTRSRTSKVHIFGKLISNERHAVTFSYNIISLFAFEQTHRYEACLVCEIFSFVGAKCCSFHLPTRVWRASGKIVRGVGPRTSSWLVQLRFIFYFCSTNVSVFMWLRFVDTKSGKKTISMVAWMRP